MLVIYGAKNPASRIDRPVLTLFSAFAMKNPRTTVNGILIRAYLIVFAKLFRPLGSSKRTSK